jgi:hypothetical protein
MLLFEYLQPPNLSLAVFIGFTDVQVEPSYSSVNPRVGIGPPPPKAKPAVCVPATS